MFGLALSGLQEYLYDLSPESPSRQERALTGNRDTKAAKRLRIRSTILSLVPGLVAWELQRRDPKAKTIYLGGGKLIMQVTAEAVDGLEPLLGELYDWLVLASGGKLGVYWRSLDEELSADSLARLLGEMSKAKYRAGRQGGWSAASGRILTNRPEDGLGDRGWEAAKGGDFARRDDIVGFTVGDEGWPIGPWNVNPVDRDPDIALAGRSNGTVEVSVPTYVPKLSKNVEFSPGREESGDEGDVAPLFWLAEADGCDERRKVGAPYLALLKLDGDGVGNSIKKSLTVGLSEFEKLSRQIQGFFGAEMTQWLSAEFPRVYLVYSGGDDLVAIGYFDDLARAALAIQKRYAKLQRGSVSAGMAFFTRQSSILKAVEDAERGLALAKETRDAVGIGGVRLGWSEWERTILETDALIQEIDRKALNRGALSLLRQLGEPWLPDAPADLAERRWRSIPQFYYLKSRREGWRTNDWNETARRLFESLETKPDDWPRAMLVGTLAGWRTKTRQEEV